MLHFIFLGCFDESKEENTLKGDSSLLPAAQDCSAQPGGSTKMNGGEISLTGGQIYLGQEFSSLCYSRSEVRG